MWKGYFWQNLASDFPHFSKISYEKPFCWSWHSMGWHHHQHQGSASYVDSSFAPEQMEKRNLATKFCSKMLRIFPRCVSFAGDLSIYTAELKKSEVEAVYISLQASTNFRYTDSPIFPAKSRHWRSGTRNPGCNLTTADKVAKSSMLDCLHDS